MMDSKTEKRNLRLGENSVEVQEAGTESRYREGRGLLKALKCELLSRVRLFMTPWTIARQAPLSMQILQVRILEWVTISFSRGSSQPRD